MILTSRFRMFFSIAWLVLSLSLGIWWWRLGLKQAKTIADVLGDANSYAQFQRVNTMLQWEGSFFLGMLLLGGLTLAFLSFRDTERAKLISDFFSTLTHEMKTPIASLQLQLEGLIEDTKDPDLLFHFERLRAENQRIQSRMNKAFYLASLMRGERVFVQNVVWEDFIGSLQMEYPNVIFETKVSPDTKILADIRALELILKNLIENSFLHGKASKVQVKLDTASKGKMAFAKITIEDDGTGFQGNFQELGKPFQRLTETSGTGIGLYSAKELIRKMNGKISFENLESGLGFRVSIFLPLSDSSLPEA